MLKPRIDFCPLDVSPSLISKLKPFYRLDGEEYTNYRKYSELIADSCSLAFRQIIFALLNWFLILFLPFFAMLFFCKLSAFYEKSMYQVHWLMLNTLKMYKAEIYNEGNKLTFRLFAYFVLNSSLLRRSTKREIRCQRKKKKNMKKKSYFFNGNGLETNC